MSNRQLCLFFMRNEHNIRCKVLFCVQSKKEQSFLRKRVQYSVEYIRPLSLHKKRILSSEVLKLNRTSESNYKRVTSLGFNLVDMQFQNVILFITDSRLGHKRMRMELCYKRMFCPLRSFPAAEMRQI
jgi:hypothetical protein